MIGWKRTKPSYEEEYKVDVPMTEPSKYGHGYTFPALFRSSGRITGNHSLEDCHRG